MSKKVIDLDYMLDNLKENKKKDIDKIARKKWKKELKNYYFVEELDDLEKGKYIKYIDLDMKQLKGGLISKIFRTNSYSIDKITLKNLKLKTLWNIEPHKCYIFQFSDSTNFFREILEGLNYTVIDDK